MIRVIIKLLYYNFDINYDNNFITIYNINNNVYLRE